MASRPGASLLGWRLVLPVVAVSALALPAASQATFTGQNGKIFYEAPESGTSGPANVFSINPDGSEPLDLTKNSNVHDERPAASADGLHVVFQTFREGGWNIFSINADGSNPTNLTKTEQPVINFEPTFSPDGTKVAFMRQGLTLGEEDIWTVGANGANPVNLTKSPGVEETSPEFSADGSKIVYISTGPTPCCAAEYNNDIWVMDANGSNQTQLTKTNFPTQNIGPAWSPDGAKIGFSTVSAPSASENGLHVMSPAGTEQTPLLNGVSPIPTADLSWSPDGTRIAYDGSGGGVFTVSASGGPSTPLVSNSGASYPSWVPLAAASGGSSNPPPVGGNGELGPPNPTVKKPLKCKKGFKKVRVKGKRPRCKRIKKHKGAKHKGAKRH